jgi:hypothetical protein
MGIAGYADDHRTNTTMKNISGSLPLELLSHYVGSHQQGT